MEVIDLKSIYKRRQTIRKLENFKQLPKGRAFKVVDLPHKDKPNSYMTFHPSQHWKNGWIEGEEYMDKGPPSLKEKWILMTCLMQLFLSNATFFIPCN